MPAMAIPRTKPIWRRSRSRRAMCFLVIIFGEFCFAIHVLRDAKTGSREARDPVPACWAELASVVRGLPCERQQGNVARLFDRGSHSTLMSRTGAGLAPGTDRAIFGDVLPKQICLFIVNYQCLISTELTKFWF